MILIPKNFFVKNLVEKILTLTLIFKPSLKLVSNIYSGKITLKEAKKNPYQMFKQLKDLEGYSPTNLGRINSKKEKLINAKESYNNRENVIKTFENGVFAFKDGFFQK